MAPASDPWSVSATAGISSSAARAASSGIRHAPSRIEYSEWTCRWTNSAMGSPILGSGPDATPFGDPEQPERDQSDPEEPDHRRREIARARPPRADGHAGDDHGRGGEERREPDIAPLGDPPEGEREDERSDEEGGRREPRLDPVGGRVP